jgi:hypothetical protein
MATNRPSLPARKTFVVQLHAEARIEQGNFKGRVEHVVSHQATHFESLEELVTFMTQMVLDNDKSHKESDMSLFSVFNKCK